MPVKSGDYEGAYVYRRWGRDSNPYKFAFSKYLTSAGERITALPPHRENVLAVLALIVVSILNLKH